MFIGFLYSILQVGVPSISIVDTRLFHMIFSFLIIITICVITRIIFKKLLVGLKGSDQFFLFIVIALVLIETVYLGISYDIFNVAFEVFASIGVSFAVIGFALRNLLKNITAGIGIYLNREIDLGDTIQVDDKIGTITEFTLTRIYAQTKDGRRLLIPNQRLEEIEVCITPKYSANHETSVGSDSDLKTV